jgi:hypothetical protein
MKNYLQNFDRFTGFETPKYENIDLEIPSVYMYGCALLMSEQMDRFFSHSVLTCCPSQIGAQCIWTFYLQKRGKHSSSKNMGPSEEHETYLCILKVRQWNRAKFWGYVWSDRLPSCLIINFNIFQPFHIHVSIERKICIIEFYRTSKTHFLNINLD